MKDFFELRESLTEDHLKIGQKVKTSDGKVGTVRAAGKGDQKGDYIIAVDGKTMSCNKSDLTVVESTDINENYRTLARAGMGTESKGEARVGLELDYYDGAGTKRMGKITKVGPKGYMVKDDKDGKVRQFTFHDRAKAKEILARLGKGKYNESVELEENKIFFVKVGDGRDSMTVKTKASNSREAVKKLKSKYPKYSVSLDQNQKQGQPAGALESVEEAVGDTALAFQTPYGTVTATKRNTKGMRGKQDGYSLSLKTKSGKTVDLGSHPKPTKATVTSIAKNVMS